MKRNGGHSGKQASEERAKERGSGQGRILSIKALFLLMDSDWAFSPKDGFVFYSPGDDEGGLALLQYENMKKILQD